MWPQTNFQVIWGGVAGGAGALLWFLLTQVKPKTVEPHFICNIVELLYSAVGLHATLSMGGKLEDIRVFPYQVADFFQSLRLHLSTKF